jgi:hypothetical protein
MAKGNKSPPCGTRPLRPKTRLKARRLKMFLGNHSAAAIYLEKDGWPKTSGKLYPIDNFPRS